MAYRATMQEQMIRKGPWLEEEDERLAAFVTLMGERRWDSLARASGLRRSGKSCRLRWLNYLRPDLKHGQISDEEEQIILQLHERWGNKWSKIARRLPGRTDNEIKNYWRTHLRKKVQEQEQEILQRAINNAVNPQDFLLQQGDRSCEDDKSRTSSDILQISDYGFAASPYEDRLFDWISGSSSGINEDVRKHNEVWNMFSSSSYNLGFVSASGDSIWDYNSSSSSWNLDEDLQVVKQTWNTQ
ncbi:hypothetical protein GIB67_000316 [Kingdonia uniflora]|uniref:Uncharacterized protein n=1 Tax=Kingdonia uniflora TaxID=39325 RepID=A0A7J7LCF8_9MAGN|nr:hypothetical protein GIB67_000316 [Kingdonia uniflora]